MDPPCTHFDGERFLVLPVKREPGREVSEKLECGKCGKLWRPSRGEFWIHAEELADLESRTEAAGRENAELRALVEEARPHIKGAFALPRHPDLRIRRAEPRPRRVILRYDLDKAPPGEPEAEFRAWAKGEGLHVRGGSEYAAAGCWLFEVDAQPKTMPAHISVDG